ncbi:MAG TPA: type VI secretion system contractile sheath large subunit [Longimicrobium sp.]|jgi:type VI secretion system protein ImpC
MPETKTAGGTATAPANTSILDQIISEGKLVRDKQNTASAERLLSKFTGEVQSEKIKRDPDKHTAALIQERIRQIDEEISRKLDAILHNPKFQELESTWRGLAYLVQNSETGTMLKLRVLNVTKDELAKDLEKAVDVDQSQLFKKLYEAEYGTFGGHPYSVLVGAYDFGRKAPDVAMLGRIASVAAAAHAPFLAAASPALFDLDSFTELGIPRDLRKALDTTEMAEWREFRKSEDSRYVALVLPRFLLRRPYHPVNNPVEGFEYTENVYTNDIHAQEAEYRNDKEKKKDKQRPRVEEPKSFLWGNAAWALAARITDAFAKYRWTAAIRGVEGGGRVAGLPVHTFDTLSGDSAMICPTEVSITDRREKELSDLGFISLVHCKGESYAAFFGGATTQQPMEYLTDSATANARLSASLPYVLAASRFAHYLKVMMRDKVGSFQTRGEIEKYLNGWIAQYVLLNDDAPQSAKARFPLREARVDVTEVGGKPGCYNATVFLRPHFQLEELTASIRLVAELPQPAA